ncbi:hypothetical protein A5714_19835 [Mycobacterium sp. E2462]|uniref:sensor domain-containing protein n=1 Tax=unclassified Mycobacterium TaxID=2642494 RepID=UPI000801C898|nr:MULTISPECIES: sensor domain-containing protein [unclassified Mycobacterium]OBG70501.1 hypothetical protein A5700_14795 [Mycobacterium sp. E1214]OBH26984.1 hypothetical protein A5693_24815 [Mycobacterium sp. E1319]OBI09256.1 hypothetical protein A5714_19835 [Mycobacterium sp. E2462]
MRQLAAIAAIAAIAASAAACGDDKQAAPASSSSSTTTTTASKPPLAQPALGGLLLTPPEVDAALGVAGSKTLEPINQPKGDNPTDVFPKSYKFPDDCLFVMGPAEASVYGGSGFTAVQGERDGTSSDPGTPDVQQTVVLFPSAQQANAFFTSSAQRWPGCSNRGDTVPGEGDNPTVTWKVGPVANNNSVLSATTSLSLSKGDQTMISGTCQRALTVRNNVVVDVEACKTADIGDTAVNVANQIAGKVDKQ